VSHAEKSIVPAVDVDIDEARMRRERLARARAALRRHGLAAALLFDPINVRYAAAPGPFAVFNLHMSFRWALDSGGVRARPVGVPGGDAYHRPSLAG
jgi:hypothetical protein